jgi:hypothetical protein
MINVVQNRIFMHLSYFRWAEKTLHQVLRETKKERWRIIPH